MGFCVQSLSYVVVFSALTSFAGEERLVALLHLQAFSKTAYQNIIFLFLNQNICCGY